MPDHQPQNANIEQDTAHDAGKASDMAQNIGDLDDKPETDDMGGATEENDGLFQWDSNTQLDSEGKTVMKLDCGLC